MLIYSDNCSRILWLTLVSVVSWHFGQQLVATAVLTCHGHSWLQYPWQMYKSLLNQLYFAQVIWLVVIVTMVTANAYTPCQRRLQEILLWLRQSVHSCEPAVLHFIIIKSVSWILYVMLVMIGSSPSCYLKNGNAWLNDRLSLTSYTAMAQG